MPKITTNRIGETNNNKNNNKMTIIEYNSATNIIVKFETGDTARTSYQHFKEGGVKSFYDKSVCGIGYLGEGIYVDINKNIPKEFKRSHIIWKGLFERCYKHYHEERNYVYNNCEVCEEWHNFQNFAKWYYDNYYEVENQLMCLDKDIPNKGNKIYSPENCVFVPQHINKIFTKSDKIRGELPIGVQYETLGFRADICRYNFSINKKQSKYLGHFKTKEEAFTAYKKSKENYIKETADYYKDQIPEKLYNAMYKYKVEITD